MKDLPLELFVSGETRWLSVQINLPGEEEQPRVQLVSVPFALKAADAETLGGKPFSAFVLTAEAAKKAGLPANSDREAGSIGPTAATTLPVAAVSGTGTGGKIAAWAGTGSTDVLGDSVIRQSGSFVGIGSFPPPGYQSPTAPDAPLHVVVTQLTDPVLKLQGLNETDSLSLKVTHPNAVTGFALAGGSGHFFSTAIQHDALVFGHGGRNLLFGLGTSEYMRVAGSGNVGIGTGLTPPSQKLDVNGNINASGNVSATGSMTAASFSGSGASLTSLNASNLSSGQVANNLTTATSASTGNTIVLRDGSGNFSAGTVTATGFSGSGSGLSNVNAAQLGGQAPSYYAPASALADYVAKSGATMTGPLTLPSNGLTVGTSQLVVSGGNVGVGAASSGQKLEVAGGIKFTSGVLTFPDTSTQSSSCTQWGALPMKAGAKEGIRTLAESGCTGVIHDLAARGLSTGGNQPALAPSVGVVLRAGAAPRADFPPSLAFEQPAEPGDVLAISATAGTSLERVSEPYSTRVAGVFAGASEVSFLAVAGMTRCKVTAENGPIAPGDLLVTSSLPGHAMKSTDRLRNAGAVLGKALEPLASGTGVIQILVTLQ